MKTTLATIGLVAFVLGCITTCGALVASAYTLVPLTLVVAAILIMVCGALLFVCYDIQPLPEIANK